MKRLTFTFVLMGLALVGVGLWAQPGLDPWWRPFNPQGQSPGFTAGEALPTTELRTGEFALDVNAAADGGPLLYLRDQLNTEWDIASFTLGTQNTVVKFGASSLVDSSITDDATNVVATAGLFTAGTAVDAADSILLDGNNDTLTFEGTVADGNEVHFVAANPNTDVTISFDNPVLGSDGTFMEIAATFVAQDVGRTMMGLHVNVASPANHLGAAVTRGIEVDNSVNTAAGEETGVHWTTGWDAEIHFADATATLWWLETGNFTLQDYGGSHTFILEDVPDLTGSDATVALVETNFTPGILDAGDILIGFSIDIDGVANHTGGQVIALDINQQTNDAQSNDVGIAFNDRFDTHIVFNDATADIQYANTGELEISDTGGASSFSLRDVPAAGTANDLMELDITLSAMDGAGDVFRGIYVDVTSADHTNGTFFGIVLDLNAQDAQAEEVAINITGFDYDLRSVGILFAALGTPANGTIVFCTDCNRATPCAGVGTGAFAFRLNGAWDCN